jgi:glycerate 2-kinase
MSPITNKETLLQNARTPADLTAREAVLEALEAALLAISPYQLIIDHVKVKDSKIVIDSEQFVLDHFKHIIVIGGGKASGSMAEALQHLLGNHITSGLINISSGTSARYRTNKVVLNEAGHPIPNAQGLEGAKRMLELAEVLDEDDLVICLISGGGSAMMTLPREGLTLEDKQMVTRLLLRSGADIAEMNTVRKHLSEFKGGWLAKKAQPATVLGLILSDVVGDPLDSIASGPTAPDPTTFRDAIDILEKYKLWNEVPSKVRDIFRMGDGGLLPETPKPNDPAFNTVHNVIIGNNEMACLAAKTKLNKLGFNTNVLTSHLQGEAREAGIFLASIASEILSSGNPLPRPAAIVVGGETTVTVKGNGIGGRNQELVLSAATKINGKKGLSIVSIGTDGIDGPTEAAGAIVDGKTLIRGREMGLDYKKALSNNDSHTYLSGLGDLVITGPTGSNVNDLAILCVT